MDLVLLSEKVAHGIVYLKDDYEDCVLKILPTNAGVVHLLKRKGKKEIIVPSSDKDIFEMKMSGYEISKEEYEKF